jgi:hypothetical protein
MLANKPKTKILVDGGDPEETLRVKDLIGFVDGQTTNPSLIAKNSEIRERIASGHNLSSQEEKDDYRRIVQAISPLVGDAGVSIEVFADMDSKAEEMLAQGEEMFSWIPNAYIKYPCTREGLRARRNIGAETNSCECDAVFLSRPGSCGPCRDQGIKRAGVRIAVCRQAKMTTAKTVSTWSRTSRKCTRMAMGTCMFWPRAYATSIICSLHLRPSLNSPLFLRRSWWNGPQKTFRCRIKTSATKLLMRVGSLWSRFRTRRWTPRVRGRVSTPRMNSQLWAFRSLWLIIGARSDAQHREAPRRRTSS